MNFNEHTKTYIIDLKHPLGNECTGIEFAVEAVSFDEAREIVRERKIDPNTEHEMNVCEFCNGPLTDLLILPSPDSH